MQGDLRADERGRGRGVLARCIALFGLVASLGCAAYDVPRLNTLSNFTPADYPNLGNFELSRLLQASDGDFYGVSAYGGANDLGYVYKVSRSTGTLTHLHDFAFDDGATPRGALTEASDGLFYGTTEAGGRNQSDYCYAGKFYGEPGCGTLFQISRAGQFKKLHDFYSADDGYQASPTTGVVQAADGSFYGMAVRAYPSVATSLFRMTAAGSVGVFRLFAADGSEGSVANAGLLKARDGSLVGTTSSAGAVSGNPAGGCGTVFKAGIDGAFRTLHVFTGAPQNGVGDGCLPRSNLIEAQDGNFYGTTLYGGALQGNCVAGGCGTVYKVSTAGAETVLHRFTATAADGEYPQDDGLVQTPDGTLYGTTGGNPYGDGFGYVPLCYVGSGTTFSCGTVYRIDRAGTFTQLGAFGDGNGAYGLFPHASLILASDGNLYGTTFAGGGWGYGTVWRLVLNAATPILSIDGFTPAGGPEGTAVTVTGNGLASTTRVTFGGGGGAVLSATFSVRSDTELTAQVPVGAQSSAIGVSAALGTVYSPAFFYLQPSIASITPTSGRPGSSVTLLGAHYDAITSIVFGGGVAATKFGTVDGTDTTLNVRVPRLAKSGPIVVTTPGGSAQSPTFVVGRRGVGGSDGSGAGGDSEPEPPVLDAANADARAAVSTVVPAVDTAPVRCERTPGAHSASSGGRAAGCGRPAATP